MTKLKRADIEFIYKLKNYKMQYIGWKSSCILENFEFTHFIRDFNKINVNSKTYAEIDTINRLNGWIRYKIYYSDFIMSNDNFISILIKCYENLAEYRKIDKCELEKIKETSTQNHYLFEYIHRLQCIIFKTYCRGKNMNKK
jgi:hypothetical protein